MTTYEEGEYIISAKPNFRGRHNDFPDQVEVVSMRKDSRQKSAPFEEIKTSGAMHEDPRQVVD